MSKLIELSIRGSLYYFLSDLNEAQLTTLRKYASKFYTEKSIQSDETDDSIAVKFAEAVQKELCISLNITPIAAVLVIK